jgi:putative phosphoesterase
MKIGVISDTHSQVVSKNVLDELKKVDLVVHAGDFCSLADYNQFKTLKEFKAVYGNMDDASLRKKLPETLVFDAEGIKIGIYHGDGAPKNIAERVKAKFSSEKVNMIIYGHSHMAESKQIGDVLLFNPGSPTDTIRAPFRSYGLIEIKNKKITAKIIKLKE